MNQLKLLNNTKYDLITNGVEESGDYLTLSFLPGLDSFETVESEFSPLNTGKIYILGLDGQPMEVKTGFTQLSEIKKKKRLCHIFRNSKCRHRGRTKLRNQ